VPENEDVLSEEEILRILLEEEKERRRLERYQQLKYQQPEERDESEEETKSEEEGENPLEQSLGPSSGAAERQKQVLYALEQQNIADRIRQHGEALEDTSSNVQPLQYLEDVSVESAYTTNAAVDLQYEKHKKEQQSNKRQNPFKTRVDDHIVG
jgi:hypothetical protein